MNKTYLIDSSIYIFRYYFSQRPSVLSKSGREVSSALEFARWLVQFLLNEKPTALACYFDESLESGFRHDIDTSYKSNRALPDDDLAYELLACKKVAELLGIKIYASDVYEADDLIAASARATMQKGNDFAILTRDKDLGQLLKPKSGCLWDYAYGDPINYAQFTQNFGIEPKHIPDFLAIAGDAADCISGVKGVGKKTVAALFTHFDGWRELKNNLNTISSLKIRGASSIEKKLVQSADRIEHNLRLTRLAFDSISLGKLNFARVPVQEDALFALLEEFNAPRNLIEKISKLNK